MKYRKLRIAWSVAWGVACLLLIALWVRSYWWLDQIVGPITSRLVAGVGTTPGTVGVGLGENMANQSWTVNGPTATDDWLANVRMPGNKPYPSRIWGLFSISSDGLAMPFWLLTMMSLIMAALPWLPMRFSLRTLLIGMTVAAIGLGWIVYLIR